MTQAHEDHDGPGVQALRASGLGHTLTRHGRVNSLAEAAAARGVAPQDMIKTMVVRRGKGDYLFVLVRGLRAISWPKLRGYLGVSRLSRADARAAREVTGSERGALRAFGSVAAPAVSGD